MRAFICSVEWQKRGLPHAHIVLWLEPEDKPQPDTIDLCVSAEISDPIVKPELHNTPFIVVGTVMGRGSERVYRNMRDSVLDLYVGMWSFTRSFPPIICWPSCPRLATFRITSITAMWTSYALGLLALL